MLIKTPEGWELAEHTVIYTQNGEQKEQVVGEEGKQWWLDFAEKWEHTEIVEFTELHYTEEQFNRLEKINGMVADSEELENYVLNGVVGVSEPLRVMRLEEMLADLTEEVLFGGVE